MESLKNSELSDTKARFTIRLPNSIHERIKDIASQSKLSVNAQYVRMVKAYLKDYDREEYESSEEYWNEIYASVPPEFRPVEEIVKSLSGDDLDYLYDEIRKAIKNLRDFIVEKEKKLAIFESRYYMAKLYYESNKKRYLDITLKDINQYSNQIENEKKFLDQAKFLLGFFQKIDPAEQYDYAPVPGTEIPEYKLLVNIRNRINHFIKNNFEETVDKLIEVNSLIKSINKSYAD